MLIYVQDLPVCYRTPPVGDDIGPDKSSQIDDDTDSLRSVEIKSVKSEPAVEDKFDPGPEVNKLTPVNFPLFSLQAKGDAMHKPSGSVPIVAFWSKHLRPKTIDRATGLLRIYVF